MLLLLPFPCFARPCFLHELQLYLLVAEEAVAWHKTSSAAEAGPAWLWVAEQGVHVRGQVGSCVRLTRGSPPETSPTCCGLNLSFARRVQRM